MAKFNFVKFQNLSEKEQKTFIRKSFTSGITALAFSAAGGCNTAAKYLLFQLKDIAQDLGVCPMTASDKERKSKIEQVEKDLRVLLDTKGVLLAKLLEREKIPANIEKNNLVVAAKVLTDEGGGIVYVEKERAALADGFSPAFKVPVYDSEGKGIFYTKERTEKTQLRRTGIFYGAPMEGAKVVGETLAVKDKKEVQAFLCEWYEVQEKKVTDTYQVYWKTFFPASDIADVLTTYIEQKQLQKMRERFKNCGMYYASK